MVDKKGEQFDFWQDHSMHYLEMAYRRDKRGRLESRMDMAKGQVSVEIQ